MTEKNLQQEKDEYWMMQALRLAQSARQQGEVPVGAVLVKNDVQIAGAWNQPITLHDPTAHAEILCLRAAAQIEKNYRLNNSTLYVTLEPCAMCAGALIHARIGRLVYAAMEPKAGCVHSNVQLFNQKCMNHRPEVTAGVLSEESSKMLSDFFAQKRNQKREKKLKNNNIKNMPQHKIDIASKLEKVTKINVSTQINTAQDMSNDFAKSKSSNTPVHLDESIEEKPIASPCVSVCALNSDDICVGCYRSCDEITAWNSLDNKAKKQVIQRANQRCKDMWA